MSKRYRLISYWLARVALNCVSVTIFWGLVTMTGLNFSPTLYFCAFAVYLVLTIGDGLINRVWPT